MEDLIRVVEDEVVNSREEEEKKLVKTQREQLLRSLTVI